MGAISDVLGNVSGGVKAPAAPAAVTPASSSQAPNAPFLGYKVITIASTALAATPTTIVYKDIGNPTGQGCARVHVQFAVTDTTGGTTAPSGVTVAETAFQQFTLKGKSGTNVLDLYGNSFDFVNFQHALNHNGVYNTSTAPADNATSTAYTSTYNFWLDKYIPPEEFPLTPTIVLNTLASRATTLNSMTSAATLTVAMDFMDVQNVPPKTKIKARNVNVSAAGLYTVTNLDKGVIYRKLMLYSHLDSDYVATNTFNFALNGRQVYNNTDYQTISNTEQDLYPISTPHITGLFPLFAGPFLSNDNTLLQINWNAAPSVNGLSNYFRLLEEEVY